VRELRGLQLALKDVRSEGGEIVVVSKDSPEELAALAKQEGLEFLLLSDASLALTDEFGVRHPGADVFRGGDLARPAVLFFDSHGRLGDRFMTENWRFRLHAEDAVKRIHDLN
jgi:peroxiredoxin